MLISRAIVPARVVSLQRQNTRRRKPQCNTRYRYVSQSGQMTYLHVTGRKGMTLK
ncbi:hypothetical protein DPMN_149304 [Dreissena polymorpha]|uniref:Uncharacterized protein n=1 Tax=Dreissena polymorpha TaxID=45954 RepID=A0A9D4FBH2_DREPO|nr:hypothetical protein DPMN_149304 [Dreissena polymorpha]